jgi:hypothetical protein
MVFSVAENRLGQACQGEVKEKLSVARQAMLVLFDYSQYNTV